LNIAIAIGIAAGWLGAEITNLFYGKEINRWWLDLWRNNEK